mmetsp:Transcript_11737/g.10369  ORF Transcript_11737/g.10369 Transcript_11737/m.10369 type:complete len:104 (+) Transcript_11737:170-481(+)
MHKQNEIIIYRNKLYLRKETFSFNTASTNYTNLSIQSGYLYRFEVEEFHGIATGHGNTILFSIPLNAISPSWALKIPGISNTNSIVILNDKEETTIAPYLESE